MQFGEEFFLLTGQSEELSTGGGRVLAMHGLGLAGLLCMIAISLFLEGLQRPVPAMIVSIGVNFVNFYLNWVFIFGNHGAPNNGCGRSGTVNEHYPVGSCYRPCRLCHLQNSIISNMVSGRKSLNSVKFPKTSVSWGIQLQSPTAWNPHHF